VILSVEAVVRTVATTRSEQLLVTCMTLMVMEKRDAKYVQPYYFVFLFNVTHIISSYM